MSEEESKNALKAKENRQPTTNVVTMILENKDLSETIKSIPTAGTTLITIEVYGMLSEAEKFGANVSQLGTMLVKELNHLQVL